MAEGKKTYYQVSFTGGQALAAVVVVLAALGLSFFLGARAGFEKTGESESAATRPEPAAPSPVSTQGTSTAASKTTAPPASPSTAASSSAAGPPATEEAPVFEDREAGVPEPSKSSSTAPSRTVIAGEGAAPAPSRTEAPAGPSRSGGAASAPAGAAPSEVRRPSEEKPSGKPAPAKGGFYVQVVSTSSKGEAVRWKEKLSARSYRTAAVSTVDSKKGKLYRVRTGPYPDRAQAKKAAAKISAEFKQKAWVAPE